MQHLNVVNFTHNHSRFVHNFRFPAIKSLQTTSHTLTNHQPNYKLNSILQTLHEHFMTTFLNYRKNCILLVFNTSESEETNCFTGFSMQSQWHCHFCNVLFTISFFIFCFVYHSCWLWEKFISKETVHCSLQQFL